MTVILSRVSDATESLNRMAPHLLPLSARFVFAAVLAGYFWSSALTKFEGPFSPSVGAYAQIFPRAFEAVNYDASGLGLWHWLVTLAGAYAEIVLPLLLILGLLTRLAALGMTGFIIVQSLTDIFGHLADASTIGAWFDRVPDALILDQRALWILPMMVLVLLGPGRISVDHWIISLWEKRAKPAQPGWG